MHADHWARSTNHDLTDFFSVIKIRLIKSTSIDIYASICNEVHVEFNGKSLLKCQCNLTRNKYGKIIHPSKAGTRTHDLFEHESLPITTRRGHRFVHTDETLFRNWSGLTSKDQ